MPRYRRKAPAIVDSVYDGLPSPVEADSTVGPDHTEHVIHDKELAQSSNSVSRTQPPGILSPRKRKAAEVYTSSVEYAARTADDPSQAADGPSLVSAGKGGGQRKTAGRPKGVGTSHGKTATQYNAEFQKIEHLLLRDLMALEWADEAGRACDCDAHAPRLYRCLDCFGSSVKCGQCFHEDHRLLPFHTVEKWNGSSFECWAVGQYPEFRLHLGHNGSPCPTVRAELDGDDQGKHNVELTVVHLHGSSTVVVTPCRCRGPRQELPQFAHQLMRARLFPSTFARPTVAYTFELMSHWHLESLQSKKSTWDYWQAVCQKTKRGAQRQGYHAFLRAGRYWRVLKMRQRAGQSLNIDSHLPPNRWPGSVVVVCPACPEPDFNLQPTWRVLVEKDGDRFKFILWHGTDASFKMYLKRKLRDPGDTSLLDGKAFFPTREEWESYVIKNEGITQESGTCPGYDKMHKIQDISDRAISGVSAVCCIRHSIFAAMGMVDLKKGEKYYMIDHGWVMAQGPNPELALPRGLSSDRACSLCIKMIARLRQEFPERENIVAIAKALTWVIPKMHIQGHCERCQYIFHLLYTPGAGRVCGEGVERPWVESNLAAAICRDANAGHRHEILNDVHNFWSFMKVIGMAKYLLSQAMEADQHIARTKAQLEEFSATLSPAKIAAWEASYPSEKAKVVGDVIRGRYCVDPENRPNQKDIIARLEEEERALLPQQSRKRGAVGMLAKGVQLAEDQARLREKARHANANRADTEAQTSIRQKRVNLAQRISSFRKLQLHHMPSLSEVLVDGDGEDDGQEEAPYAEDVPLMLPSSFSTEARREMGISPRLGELENQLRRAHAEAVLTSLRFSIRTFGCLADETRDQVDTTSGKTRARSYLQKMKGKQRAYVKIYNSHLTALRALGLSADDTMYRDLDTSMLRAHPPTDKPQPLNVGRKSNDVAWFWRGELDVSMVSHVEKAKLALLTDDDNRVRYFRLKGHNLRWTEQMAIVGAEFGRCERHFTKMGNIWATISKEQLDLSASLWLVAEASRAKYAADPNVPAWQHQPGQELQAWRDARGSSAYAHQKASFYNGLAEEIRKLRAVARTRCATASDWNLFDADLYPPASAPAAPQAQ